MFANRIREHFAPILTPAATDFQPAFVACPLPVFSAFTPSHQAFVAEVYRRAQELTEAQLRKPARRPIPEFSLN